MWKMWETCDFATKSFTITWYMADTVDSLNAMQYQSED